MEAFLSGKPSSSNYLKEHILRVEEGEKYTIPDSAMTNESPDAVSDAIVHNEASEPS